MMPLNYGSIQETIFSFEHERIELGEIIWNYNKHTRDAIT